MGAKNSAGYKNRNQMFLLSKQQDKSYHRIVGRQWFRNGNATSQVQAGVYGRHGGRRAPQASLFSASTTQYLDIHGWEEISNFTLARILSDREFKMKQVGNNFEVIVTFQYGES